MARGWESKTIEEQINAREAVARISPKATLTAEQAERQSKREGLLLMRARVVSELQSTRHARRRELLARALEHLDAQLAELEAVDEP